MQLNLRYKEYLLKEEKQNRNNENELKEVIVTVKNLTASWTKVFKRDNKNLFEKKKFIQNCRIRKNHSA
jgi:hypothetical protein